MASLPPHDSEYDSEQVNAALRHKHQGHHQDLADALLEQEQLSARLGRRVPETRTVGDDVDWLRHLTAMYPDKLFRDRHASLRGLKSVYPHLTAKHAALLEPFFEALETAADPQPEPEPEPIKRGKNVYLMEAKLTGGSILTFATDSDLDIDAFMQLVKDDGGVLCRHSVGQPVFVKGPFISITPVKPAPVPPPLPELELPVLERCEKCQRPLAEHWRRKPCLFDPPPAPTVTYETVGRTVICGGCGLEDKQHWNGKVCQGWEMVR